MKIRKNILTWTILLLMLTGFALQAQEVPPRPQPPRLVNDLAGLLTREQVDALENKLVAFNDTTSNQIAIVIMKDLGGYEPSDMAYRIGEEWGVGQKAFDNGIVVLLVPKQGNQKGDVWIATGYGLEGAIPDAACNRITDREMIPRFRSNDYYGGLEAGTSVLMSLAAKEYSYRDYMKKTSGGGGYLLPLLFIIIVVVFMIRRKRNYYAAGSSSLPFWASMLLMSQMNRNRDKGSWGNFSSGSGHFGGFGGSGGGFGGFGGGSFGGGGAGGSW
jgi:uncharacterized protein